MPKITDLPDVHFGKVSEQPGDDFSEDDTPDDDRELAETPRDVVELLGFDPKEADSVPTTSKNRR